MPLCVLAYARPKRSAYACPMRIGLRVPYAYWPMRVSLCVLTYVRVSMRIGLRPP